MLLLDRDGHVVGKGRLRDQPQARAAWPPELFAPLQRFGIRVVSENYPTPRALERAHPGAAPSSGKTTRRCPCSVTPLASGCSCASVRASSMVMQRPGPYDGD